MKLVHSLLSVCLLSTIALIAQETALVIPHTHWEGAVFKTREEYLEVGLPHILKALTMLKTFPEYRFVLDQMCYVRPFLERYPAEVPAFRKFLQEGRLQLAGGTVYLCHPFLAHAAQPHRGTNPRFMAQPPLYPAAPFELDRPDGDYSPVEIAIRSALGL